MCVCFVSYHHIQVINRKHIYGIGSEYVLYKDCIFYVAKIYAQVL